MGGDNMNQSSGTVPKNLDKVETLRITLHLDGTVYVRCVDSSG
jgi:hypothetical protein